MNMKKILLGLLLLVGVSSSLTAQGFKEHTIVAGETLGSIVEKYQVSPYELYQLNPDVEDGLAIGDVLVLLNNNQYPFDATLVDLKKYKVKKKETLKMVAKAHGVEESDIKKYNTHLYSNPISKGDKIKIPVFNKNLETTVIVAPVNTIVAPDTKQLTKTIRHEVQAKEGKYGISKKYGIPILELEAQNPEIVAGLKIGQVLTITKNEIIATDPVVDEVVTDQFSYYTVQAKEGYYRLTKKLGISKDSLIALNPTLSEGIKLGMELKYPKSTLFKSAVPSFKLLDSMSNYETKNITLMLPLMLDKIVENDSIDNLKNILLINKYTQRSLDFYSGVLMAVDSMRKMGVSTRLRVFDTRYNRKNVKSNSERISELLAKEYKDNEVVIGPLVSVNVLPVASGLAERNIPVLAPFPLNKIPESGNIYKTNASIDFQKTEMIRFIESYSVGKPIIIITDKKMNALKEELKLKFPLAKIVNPREGNLLIPKDFNGLLSDEIENIVIVEAKEVGLLSTVSTILDTKLKKHAISLFTTSSYSTFESLENRYKAKLNLHFPAVSKQTFLGKESSFFKQYKAKYATLPSRYALRGFDLTMDVLLRQAVSGTFEKSALKIGETSYISNKFNYHKASNGGFVNKAMYILRYTPDLTIEEASLVSKQQLID
jgi:LysM repeat protein